MSENWTDVPDSQLTHKAPWTFILARIFRDNLAAGLRGGAGARINSAAWHPYNKVTQGDANDGLLYDQAVDGNTSSVTSPDFEDGYEYAFILENIGTSQTSAAFQRLIVEGYEEAAAGYNVEAASGEISAANDDRIDAQVFLSAPRILSRCHGVDIAFNSGRTTGRWLSNSAQRILRARLYMQEGDGSPNYTFDRGKIYMLRRREFVTG